MSVSHARGTPWECDSLSQIPQECEFKVSSRMNDCRRSDDSRTLRHAVKHSSPPSSRRLHFLPFGAHRGQRKRKKMWDELGYTHDLQTREQRFSDRLSLRSWWMIRSKSSCGSLRGPRGTGSPTFRLVRAVVALFTARRALKGRQELNSVELCFTYLRYNDSTLARFLIFLSGCTDSMTANELIVATRDSPPLFRRERRTPPSSTRYDFVFRVLLSGRAAQDYSEMNLR